MYWATLVPPEGRKQTTEQQTPTEQKRLLLALSIQLTRLSFFPPRPYFNASLMSFPDPPWKVKSMQLFQAMTFSQN